MLLGTPTHQWWYEPPQINIKKYIYRIDKTISNKCLSICYYQPYTTNFLKTGIDCELAIYKGRLVMIMSMDFQVVKALFLGVPCHHLVHRLPIPRAINITLLVR